MSRRPKSEKEREKQTQDRLQLLLTRMLKDDDNKYCVDCDSKGPRWASWNLGLFLCIRCAGIHRNLGVHISKVKSVNLDSWTPVQVSSMQLMGNSRARAVYEANLPDGFLRPQSDQALEQFIRAKYEKKKYVAKEYVPQKPNEYPEGWFELIEAEKQKKDLRKVILPSHTGFGGAAAAAVSSKSPASQKQEDDFKKSPSSSVTNGIASEAKSPKEKATPPKSEEKTPKSSQIDLLGLGIGLPPAGLDTKTGKTEQDMFGLGSSVVSNSNGASEFGAKASADDDEKNFFNETSSTEDKSKMTKDSIMALFAQNSPQQNFMQNGAHQGGSTVSGFGLNPQSNPFLASSSQPLPNQSIPGLLGQNFIPSQQQRSYQQTNQLQNQFGGLNLGTNSFGGFVPASTRVEQVQQVPLKPTEPSGATWATGALTPQPAAATTAAAPTATAATTNQDILGLW